MSGGYAGYLAQAAAQWPARVGLRFGDAAWTYAALDAAAERAADRLAVAGIAAGDRVALLVENCPEYLIAQFALARLGAAFVTPNPYWTTPELTHALDAAASTAVIHTDRFSELAARLPIAVSIDTLLDSAPARSPDPQPAPRAPRYVPFPSGTTGLPKGVLHTDESLCGGVEQLRHHLALSATDHIPIALPLCHVFGATMCAAVLSVGAELSLFRRFDLDEALEHMAAGRATIWPLAGSLAHQLAERDDLRREDFASLRYFMWGGSAVPVALADQITAHTGVRFLCSYGMTEAMMVAFNPVDDPDRWQLDSPGYPTHGTELRLTAAGELEVRGPSVAIGYASLDSPDFRPDGWFRTGDLGTIDDDGRLRVIDRVKDMHKVSGFQVAPTEVESALQAHPDVDEVAVVGRPDERTGQAVVAFVVGRSVDVATLRTWVSDRLASYKRPVDYRVVTELPRTVGGKVRRKELRALAAADQPMSS